MTLDQTVEATTSQDGPRPVLQLARAAGGSFGLSVLNTAATLVTTVLLARLLGVTDYGVFAFVIATVTLLAVPAIVGFDRLLVRDVAVYSEQRNYALARGLVRRAAQLVLVISVSIALVSAVVAWFASGGEVSAALLAFWVGVAALPVLALLRVAQSALMGLGHVVLGQSGELLIRPVAFLVLLLVAFVATGGVLDATAAIALHVLSLVVACAALIVLLRSRTPPSMTSASAQFRTRDWAMAALSLGFLSGAAIVNTQTGVVLLGALAGPESAGLYSVAQRGAVLVAFPLAAVGTAIAPMAARLWTSHEREHLQRLVTASARWALLGCLPIAAGFILFGQQILGFFFGSDFAAAAPALSILTVGQVVNTATGSASVLLVMTGNQRLAALGITFGAILNIGVTVLLIPSLDVDGAAIAATASLIVSNLLLVLLLRRTLRIDSTALGIGVPGGQPEDAA
jgi:O-antigen/teichoic acid export membrane protein